MRRPYSGPTLTRFGAFGELTMQDAPAGKTAIGTDTNPVFGDLGICNPNSDPSSVNQDACTGTPSGLS